MSALSDMPQKKPLEVGQDAAAMSAQENVEQRQDPGARRGFVYLMGNSHMPGQYKIGATRVRPELRAAELSMPSGVPGPFKVLCAVEVDDPFQMESAIHHRFRRQRLNDQREFFTVGIEGVELHHMIDAIRDYPGAVAVNLEDHG